jgi:hypothetical protein
MNIDKFIAKYPPESIDIQQLFDITVFYSRFEDVKYLLQHYKNKISIDLCNVMDTEVFKVIVESLKIGQITISKTKTNLIKFNSKFIPIIIKNYTGELDDYIYRKFIDIALESNDRNTIKYLLSIKSESTIKKLVNKYLYVILQCCAGNNEIIGENLNIVIEIGDECFQTAYLCKNFNTVRYLVNMQIRIQNCFLKEKILCDEYLWERNRNEQKKFLNYYSCANCG